MGNVAVVTQAELAAIKDSLEQIATNLNVHVNHSLSKAHGINLVTGYTDDYGNDLTTYQSASGDVIGHLFLCFDVAGSIYYAPANTTARPGQSASNGSLDTNPDLATQFESPGRAALVTEFGNTEAQKVVNVNDLLLTHTLTAHQFVHSFGGQMQAIARNTFDSSGSLIGRYVILFVVNGIEYEIPCDTRFGGPPQPPYGVWVTTTWADHHAPAYYDGEKPGNFTLNATANPCVVARGTKPFTFQWFLGTTYDSPDAYGNDPINSPANWVALTKLDGTTTGVQTSYDGNLRLTAKATNTATQSVIDFYNIALADVRTSNQGIVKCVVSNAGGSTVSINYFSFSYWHHG